MKLTEKEVRYVANLANLRLTGEEVARMVNDLGGILDHMDKLAENRYRRGSATWHKCSTKMKRPPRFAPT